jgi:hypothetical protein
MIKSIRDNYRIYGLIIVKTTQKSLVLEYELLNAKFETLNHVIALPLNGKGYVLMMNN